MGVQEKLENAFLERFDQVHSTIDAMSDRLGSVEKDFSQSRARYIREMEDQSAFLDKDLSALKITFDKALAMRREKESMIFQKVEELQARTAEKFDHERQINEHKSKRLFEDLEESKRVRELAHKRFQESAKAELEDARRSCEAEAKARAQADDDIVSALNQYTKGLQEALRSVSQTRPFGVTALRQSPPAGA